MPESIRGLLILYSGIMLFNAVLSGYLWRSTRSKPYLSFLKVWISLFLAFGVQGSVAGQLGPAMSTSYLLLVVAGVVLGRFIAEVAGFRYSIKPVLWITAIGYTSSLYVAIFRPSFFWLTFTMSFAVSYSFAHVAIEVIRHHWRTSSFAVRGLALSSLFQAIHIMDYPFFANVPEFAPIGFSISITQIFMVSVFGPLTITEALMSESGRIKLEKQALERDMEVTGAVQALFLPALQKHAVGSIQLVGYSRSAAKSGGDWWWHDRLDDGRLLVMIGDVTGHGPGPAMITGVVATAYSVLKKFNPSPSLGDVFQSLNQALFEIARERYSMTLSAFTISADSKMLELAFAGAPPIFVMDRNGKAEALAEPSQPMGFERHSFRTLQRPLLPGDRVFAFTDGVFEVESPRTRYALGMRRLMNLLSAQKDRDVADASAVISQELVKELGDIAPADDMTFVLAGVSS